jgi:hypothetical protein
MSYFGVGTLRYNKIHRSVIYSVKDLKSLTNIIIPFFDKYHLVTQKRADFELFKQVVEKMNRKEDITRDGLLEIVARRASMNRGLTKVLKQAFPDVLPVQRPVVQLPESIEPT